MAKQTGLGDNFYVGQYDLSGDVGALSSIASSRAVIDVTGLNKSGYERILGRADGSMAFAAYFNPSAGQAHPVLSAVGTVSGTAAASIVTYAHGTAVGNDAASLSARSVDYPMTVGTDLSIALSPSAQAAAGSPVEWGLMLTAGRQVFSGTAANASVDAGAATSFGGAAYLHAFALTSGTATVTVEHSTDDSSWSSVGGLAWTVTAATSSRLATTTATTTVNRYRRVNVTGTFSGLDCFVGLVVYPTSQT